MRHRNGINDTLPIGTKKLNPGATNFDASSVTQQMRRYESAAEENDTKETMLVQSEVGRNHQNWELNILLCFFSFKAAGACSGTVSL